MRPSKAALRMAEAMMKECFIFNEDISEVAALIDKEIAPLRAIPNRVSGLLMSYEQATLTDFTPEEK